MSTASIRPTLLHEDERREQRELSLRQRAAFVHRRRQVRMSGEPCWSSLVKEIKAQVVSNCVCDKAKKIMLYYMLQLFIHV